MFAHDFSDGPHPLARVVSPLPDAERTLSAREEVAQIERLVKDHAHAVLILEGIYCGMTGPEIQKELGISKNDYEAIMKWMRRRQEEALRAAIGLWADATTGSSVRRRDEMLQKKNNDIAAFFHWLGKRPAEVAPGDVQAWQEKLKRDGLRPATIYARVSFYSWAQRDPRLRRQVRHNLPCWPAPMRQSPTRLNRAKPGRTKNCKPSSKSSARGPRPVTSSASATWPSCCCSPAPAGAAKRSSGYVAVTSGSETIIW
jgi:hypothetical protein